MKSQKGLKEEKGCGYRTTPARQKGTAVLSSRGLGRHTESPQGAKRSETKFTPEGVPVKIYTRVSSQTNSGKRIKKNARAAVEKS